MTRMFSTFLSTFMKMALSIHQVLSEIMCIVVLVQDLGSKGPPTMFRYLLRPFRNINIPWPSKGMGDADYLYAFQQVVMPVAYDFDPDLVISEFSNDIERIKAKSD